MRGWLVVPLIGVMVVTLGTAKEAKPPFSLTITTNASVKAGGEILIHLAKLNTSDKDIRCQGPYDSALGVDLSREYLVRDESGVQLEKRPANPRHRSVVDVMPCFIPPGEKSSQGATITNLYDMSKPGQYSVQVREPVLDKNDKVIGWVKSNVITVTVTP